MFPRRVHVLRFGLIVALIGAAFALFFVISSGPQVSGPKVSVDTTSPLVGRREHAGRQLHGRGLPSIGLEGAQMRALKREIDQLPKGKIYLNAPVEMKVGDKRIVDARVGVKVPDDILRGHARAGEHRTEGMLRVSHEMVATLSAPGFAITSITPEKQAVAEGFPTVWEWEVEAKVEGAQELEATLYALVPDSPSTTAQQRIDSYTQKINVSVKPQTWGEWLNSTSEEVSTIKAILLSLGAIAAAVLSWLGFSRKRQRSVTPPTTPRAPKRQVAKTGGKGGEKAA
jgi:hypothetical protein